MNTITKKHFIDALICNESEFLSGNYVRDMTITEILEYLQTVDFEKIKGERRQGFKHSNGLKFLKDDGTYSYTNNLVNHDYYQFDNVLITIKEEDDCVSLLIYRIV